MMRSHSSRAPLTVVSVRPIFVSGLALKDMEEVLRLNLGSEVLSPTNKFEGWSRDWRQKEDSCVFDYWDGRV
jgi:hypothetical protein